MRSSSAGDPLGVRSCALLKVSFFLKLAAWAVADTAAEVVDVVVGLGAVVAGTRTGEGSLATLAFAAAMGYLTGLTMSGLLIGWAAGAGVGFVVAAGAGLAAGAGFFRLARATCSYYA